MRQFVKAEGFGLDLMTFQVVALDQPSSAPLRVALREPLNQARFTSQWPYGFGLLHASALPR